MREKSLRQVVTFQTATDAMAMEKYCLSRKIPGRLIPLPEVISADCGLCWSAPVQTVAELETIMQETGLRYAGIYTLML